MAGIIVICNEERFVRWALLVHLQGCGFTVFEAHDVLTAQKMAKEHAADALLIDSERAEEVMALIHDLKKSRCPSSVVLFMKDDNNALKNISLEHSCVGLVKKPFRLGEIDVILKKIIKRAKSA